MPDPRTFVHAALPLVTSLKDCADYTKTVAPFLPQLYELPAHMAAHMTDPHGLQSVYAQTNPLVSSLAFALFLTPVVLAVSEANKNYSQIDRLWSILPVIYNVHYAVWASINALPTHRLNHVMAVSIIWGLRLSFNYWRKGGYRVGSEDYRWEIVKAYIGPAPMFILNVVFISLAQNILLWVITAPTYILLLTSRITGDTVSQYDSLFSKAMLFLVVVEFFADGQQWAYYHARELYRKSAKLPADKKYTREQLDRGFNTTGLFAWSRHPNFAAEQAFWVCLYQWGCLESWTYVNWTGAAAFGYLILFQSSTWLTELLSSRKYPEYKIYQDRVGKFLPKANTKSMDAPATPKEEQKVEAATHAKPLKGQKMR